jgi:hypothetical protein
LTDTTDKSIPHPFPHVQSRIDTGGDCAFDKPPGVAQQNFVVSNVDPDRRRATHVRYSL